MAGYSTAFVPSGEAGSGAGISPADGGAWVSMADPWPGDCGVDAGEAFAQAIDGRCAAPASVSALERDPAVLASDRWVTDPGTASPPNIPAVLKADTGAEAGEVVADATPPVFGGSLPICRSNFWRGRRTRGSSESPRSQRKTSGASATNLANGSSARPLASPAAISLAGTRRIRLVSCRPGHTNFPGARCNRSPSEISNSAGMPRSDFTPIAAAIAPRPRRVGADCRADVVCGSAPTPRPTS